MTTEATLPEVPTMDAAEAFVRAHVQDDPTLSGVEGNRFLRSAKGAAATPTSAAAVNAAAAAAAGRSAQASRPALTVGAALAEADATAGRAPRTIERALLELALVPEAGWTAEQASQFAAAARAGSRSPADVVQLVAFLRSWNALPKIAAAARFACTLLSSGHGVGDIERCATGVWSYSRRQARALRAELTPAQELTLLDAALANPRPGKQVLLLLDAVDNEGGFHGYRADLRIAALEAALRSTAAPQDALQWALDARRIGIDDEADVAVFVRLLTQP